MVGLAFVLLAVTTPLAETGRHGTAQARLQLLPGGRPRGRSAAGPARTRALRSARRSNDRPDRSVRQAGQSSRDLRGHPVWLNFWATWCPPCQEETPVLRDTFAAFEDKGLAIVAVSVQETSVDDVKNYVNTYGLDYTVGFDATSAVFHTYHAFGLPTQVFIDGNGVIQKVIYGPVTREEAAGYIEPLLLK